MMLYDVVSTTKHTSILNDHPLKKKNKTIKCLKKSIDCLIQHTIFSTIQHQQNVVN